MTPAGEVPVEGVAVGRAVVDGWRGAKTDKDGSYQMLGMSDSIDTVEASKDGYQRQQVNNVSIKGDTRFDIRLVRR